MSKYNKPIGESGIEWTGRTWNPTTGCDKVSAGCKFCYAEPLAHRLQAMGNKRYTNGFQVTLHPDKLAEPLGWAEPDIVFVNSMSDALHKDIPDGFLRDLFAVMRRADWHIFQVLTKRPERWSEVHGLVTELGPWPRNVLPGTSIEDKRALRRLPLLRKAGGDDPGVVRMVSVEPLLESLCDGDVAGLAEQLTEGGVGWVIAGGEATIRQGCRPADPQWFRELRDACGRAGIPYFFKQYGGRATSHEGKRGGLLAVLDGRLHHEMPEVWRGLSPSERKRGPGGLFA